MYNKHIIHTVKESCMHTCTLYTLGISSSQVNHIQTYLHVYVQGYNVPLMHKMEK